MMIFRRAAWAMLLLVSSGCFGSSEFEEYEVGFQGLAARNPYLGAQLLAQELGYGAEGTTVLTNLPPTDWAMLMRDGVMTGGEPQARDLLAWAADGGDLWVDLGDTSVWDDDANPDEGPSHWALYELLDVLELDVVDNEGDEGRGVSFAPELDLPWPEESVVLGDPERRSSVYWGSPTFASMLRLPWGRGNVSFFCSLHGFDNHNLKDGDWAEFFEQLLGGAEFDEPVKGLMVVYGGERSFMALLWRHAWFFLVAMGGLLALWLWRVSRRFGPILEDPAWDPEGVGIGGGREFTEHIVAAGKTYERRGQCIWLLKAAEGRVASEQRDGGASASNLPKVSSTKSAAFLKQMQVLQTKAHRKAQSATRTTETQEKEQ